MNTVAETLTGWTEREAKGSTLDEVFHIVHEESRAMVESPVVTVLRERTIVGLANHTVLIGRDGTERPIEDSDAPIMEGAVLVGVVPIKDQLGNVTR
jgi:PAS domain S-box-containing protein